MTKAWYKRRWFWIVPVAVLVTIGLGYWLLVTGRLLLQPRLSPTALPSVDIVDREAVSTEWVKLYFSDSRTGDLTLEPRQVVALSDPADRIRVIVEELLAGPRADLTATLPPTAQIREVFLDSKGGLYLDFSGEFVADQLSGTGAEIAAVGSIMMTVANNAPDIVLVQLLVNGSEIETINGHLRADRPFLISEWK